MADFNSSLPVRTENNGDVVAFLADATTPSQLAKVDNNGSQQSVIRDVSGNAVTSQANGGQRALDVMSQTSGPVAPGTAANFSSLTGGQFNTALPTLTNGQQSAIQLDSSGRVLVHASNFPNTVDTNYGAVGASTLRTASQVGNATGAADFNFGTVGAQTLRVGAQIGNATGAADFNFGASSAQTVRVAALLGNAAGVIAYDFGASSAQTIRVAALLGNAAGVIDYNFGAVGAQTVRVASQIGNATGAADYNNGATGAQTLRVAANLAIGGANVSSTNPIPVTLDGPTGTAVNDYKTAAAVAAAASDNHDYTVTAGKTLHLNQVEGAGTGKVKMLVQVETGVGTNVFTTLWARFNSTADPNVTPLHIDNPALVAAGVRVRVILTNNDKQAQDLYSTISGFEI